jgi:hypothetical protein
LQSFFRRTDAGGILVPHPPPTLAHSRTNRFAVRRASSSSECAKSPVIRGRAEEVRARDKLEQRRFVAALETLPHLTRAAFLLSARDNLPYIEIGWRCGISVDEVTVRIGDALLGIDRALSGRPNLAGHIRRELLPYREAWAAARKRQGDRSLAPSPKRKPGRRHAVDWVAAAFELLFR